MLDKLQKLFANRFRYSKDEQAVIESWMTSANELALIEEVKKTPAWQAIEAKIRIELKMTILELVKDDKKVTTLLQVLSSVNAQKQQENLTQVINDVLTDY